MSNLDHIISLVNNIESKTSNLISKSKDSLNLLNHANLIYDGIGSIDEEIEEIDQLIDHNYTYQQHFKNLNERLFFLEQSLNYNDVLVNRNTFEGLVEEYMTVVDQLKVNDEYIYTAPVKEEDLGDVSWASIDDVEEEEEEEEDGNQINYEPPEDVHLESPPDIRKMISISNLKLKPIHCSSQTRSLIQKKKSRYRLSGIYNINPIAYEESTSGSSTTDTSFGMPTTPTRSLHRDILPPVPPTTPPSRIISSGGESTNTYQSSNLMQTDNASHSTTTSSISLSSPILKLRRSKSMDEMDSDNIFKEFNCDQDVLRFNRLKHFISLNHIPSTAAHDDSIDSSYDMVSVCSDMSYYSPEEQEKEKLQFDDFSKFLRSSRVELNKDIREAFPHLVPDPQHKFHNPSENINRSGPTLSTISKDEVNTKYHHKQDPKEFLTRVISSSSLPGTPTASPKTYRRFVASPSTKRKPHAYSSPTRLQLSPRKSAKSIHYSSPTRFPSSKSKSFPNDKSITTSLLELIQSKASTLISSPTKLQSQTTSVPGSIKQMCILRDLQNKSRLHKTSPIRGMTDSQLKRLPLRTESPEFTIESNSKSKSTLTIAPKKTGDIFKQPVIVRTYNEKALKEALAASLLE